MQEQNTFNSIRDFVNVSECYGESKYATLVHMMSDLNFRYSVENFTVNKTKFGNTVEFLLNGQNRKIEYINLFLDSGKDSKYRDLEYENKIAYLKEIVPDGLILKAIPDLDRYKDFFTVATANVEKNDNAIIVTDNKLNDPKDQYIINRDQNKKTVDGKFGYSDKMIISSGKHIKIMKKYFEKWKNRTRNETQGSNIFKIK